MSVNFNPKTTLATAFAVIFVWSIGVSRANGADSDVTPPSWQQAAHEEDGMDKKDPQKSLDINLKLMQLEKEQGAPLAYIFGAYQRIGHFYYDLKRYEESAKTYKEGADLAHEKQDANMEADLLNRYTNSLLAVHEHGSGEFPLLETEMNALSLATNPHTIAMADLQIGKIYLEQRDFKNAEIYSAKAFEAYKQLGEQIPQCDALSDWIRSLIARGNLDQANTLFIENIRSLQKGYPHQIEEAYTDALISRYNKLRGDDEFLNNIRRCFDASEFAALDEIYNELLKSKKMLPSGKSYLIAYFSVLAKWSGDHSDAGWVAHIDKIKTWVKERPNSDAAKLALVNALTNFAWKARGSGYADTVTPAGGRDFAARLAEAEDVLQSMPVHSPIWYSSSQTVALGQGWDKDRYDKMVQECRKAYPEYYTVVFNKLYHLLPRWYGAEGEASAYLDDECAKLSKEDGDILYARAAASLRACGVPEPVKELNLSYPRCKSGFEIMIKAHPDWLFIRGLLVVFAMQSDDVETATSAFASTLKTP